MQTLSEHLGSTGAVGGVSVYKLTYAHPQIQPALPYINSLKSIFTQKRKINFCGSAAVNLNMPELRSLLCFGSNLHQFSAFTAQMCVERAQGCSEMPQKRSRKVGEAGRKARGRERRQEHPGSGVRAEGAPSRATVGHPASAGAALPSRLCCGARRASVGGGSGAPRAGGEGRCRKPASENSGSAEAKIKVV